MSLRPEDQYHVGIVVDDFDAAIARLGRIQGYSWGHEITADTDVRYPDGSVGVISCRFVYSVNEPRLEIIRSIPGTLWEPADSELHHLGYWSDDVTEDIAELVARGYREEVAGIRPDDGSVGWAFLRGPQGLRIELVERTAQEALARTWGG